MGIGVAVGRGVGVGGMPIVGVAVGRVGFSTFSMLQAMERNRKNVIMNAIICLLFMLSGNISR